MTKKSADTSLQNAWTHLTRKDAIRTKRCRAFVIALRMREFRCVGVNWRPHMKDPLSMGTDDLESADGRMVTHLQYPILPTNLRSTISSQPVRRGSAFHLDRD